MNERDFIVIAGNQGFGKTVWAKLFERNHKRSLVFDPQASYATDFQSDPADWVPKIVCKELDTFRYGVSYPWELEMLANTAYAAGNCLLTVEECALIFKRGEELHDWAKPIVFMGRSQRISIVLIAQRASKIPVDIRSQATRFISFRQTEPNDVKALIDRFGEIAEDVPMLNKLECIDWNDSNTSRYTINPAY